MNFTKYDYYGNYNKDDDMQVFTVQEIHRKQKEKENSRINIYKSITNRCFKKIKETSLNEETFCFFRIPEYIPGLPLYNMTECVMFILNILREKGFSARYCDHFTMYIAWNLPKPNLKLLEPPPEPKPEKKSIIDDLNLKYKPIENYTAFGRFIPRKKV
jgi:hypothetical protein